MPRTAALLAALAFLAAVPAALAHDPLEAAELETQVLEDEADDSFYVTGGFDVWQLFVGEAHVPEIGAGPAGDGLYFRTSLFGDFAGRPANVKEYRVTFTFETPAGSVTRYLATTDGTTFDTDFDALLVEPEDDQVVVQRAFVSYASAGVAPGDAVGAFLVESLVDGEVRDRAPGGILVPGTGGRVEVPMESKVLEESVTLTGPGRYVRVTPNDMGGGAYSVSVASALKEGGQHVHLEAPRVPGWTLTLEGENGGNLKPGDTKVIRFRLDASGEGEVAPATLDVTTDLGGRSSVIAAVQGGKVVLLPDGAEAAPGSLSALGGASVPGAGALGALLAAVAVALARRR